jgi:NADP-dependent 3-hydroxy acid dehydrogenase YdfG
MSQAESSSVVTPWSGRRALVTGASSGIGYATALSLLRAGATVVATGRRIERLQALGADPGHAARLMAIVGDVDDDGFRRTLSEQAGAVDILVNAAGVLKHTPFLDGDPTVWEQMWRTNVQSVLCLTQLIARGMVDRRSGHIVNISSILASRVFPYSMVYASTKFAIRAISQGLRLELREHGIKVTEVAPGQVKTEIFRDEQHPLVAASYRGRTFLPLAADDVAAAIISALGVARDVGIDLIEVNPRGQG